MSKFKSRVDSKVKRTLWSFAIVCWILFLPVIFNPEPWTIFSLALPNILITLGVRDILSNTYYQIQEGSLKWRVGIFSGKIK
ncbi:MAG: hypothetical protein AAFY41_02275, partial [Bacteroidota bacterium]